MNKKENIINKLEQGRAEFAYRCVKNAVDTLDDRKKKDYRSYSRKIPTMILSNGLGQTLAYVKAKAKAKDGNAYKVLYQQMTNYLKSECSTRIKMPSDKTDLVEWVISINSSEYRLVTSELLSFLNWLKRFAEGLIDEEGENENKKRSTL